MGCGRANADFEVPRDVWTARFSPRRHLKGVFNASTPHAAAIILIDRAISVFSIVIFGSIAYVMSSKPRGGGMKVEEIDLIGAPAG